MADRYWVGGTGSWSSTNTANWSDTSGGAGGFSVPTAADNVFFDVNSNVGTGSFTVTMANTPRVCNDFTASGLDGTMTLAGSNIGLTVSGSLSFPATNFTRTYTGTTTFNATTTGKTITTNGVALATVDFNGVGGGWTLGSALSCGAITVTNGTFDTSSSGNYAITASSLSSSNSNARTINLNASLVQTALSSSINFSTSTNLTFNAGTSSITVASSLANFSGGGQTFYNVSFTSTALSTPSITGANTFNNLTVTGRTSVGIGVLSLSANQTVNGTFTVNAGTASAYRTMIASDVIGTPRTLTCAAESLTDVDFRDIIAAGAGSPFTGTRLGDCKGNSNITFPTAKTVYFGRVGSGNWGSSLTGGAWSATSGGSLDATQFPLAQDTAVFPAATYPASGSTITINANYNIGTIDMSLRTSDTMTLATGTTNPAIYGNWINGTGITLSGTNTITFAGRITQQITSAGRAFTQDLTFNSPSGTIQLQDALTTATARTTTLTQGTLDLQSYTLSTGLFSSSNSNTRTIAFGTGNITCTGTGTAWTTATATNLTTTGTQVVNVTSTGSTAITVNAGSLSEANSISYNFTGGTYALTFLSVGNNSARNIDFTGYAGNWNSTSGVNVFIYGDLKLSSGMTLTAGTGSWTFAATSGIKSITTNGKTIDRPIVFSGAGGTWNLEDAFTMGSTRTATLTNGTLDLNGKTMTVGTRFSTSIGTKNLTFNGGTLVCPDPNTTSFYNVFPTNFTTTAGTGTGTISMTAATAKTFVGGGSTYNCTLNQGGIGTLTVSGNNTFSNLTNTVNLTTVLFTGGTTNIFTNFNLTGVLLNLVTLGSTNTTQATLQKGSTWFMGANSTNGGNNTGLTFTAGGGIDYLNVSYINGTVVGTGYTISADNGTYAVTGQSATLLRSKVLSGDYGLYTLAGQDASIRRTRLFEANTGQYALTGQDAIITLGGSPIVVDEQLLIKLRSFTERRRF